MSAADALADRVRAQLPGGVSVREVRMFGTRSYLVDGALTVGARSDGGLLVRVDADRHAELVARPGAAQAEMGTGRTMGAGWIEVAPSVLGSDAELAFWVGVALARNRATRSGR